MSVRAAVLAVILLASLSAHGESCPVPKEGAALAGVPAEARLAWLRETLQHEADSATWWRWTWAAAFGAGATVQFALTPALPTALRPQIYTDGAATALLVLPPLAWPLKVTHDDAEFESRIQSSRPDEVCRLVALGEETMVRDAINEAVHAGWVPQLVNASYDVLVALVVGLVMRQWLPAVVSGLGGLILGEAYILTQPAHLKEAWQAYQAGQFAPPAKPAVSWAPSTNGFGVSGTF